MLFIYERNKSLPPEKIQIHLIYKLRNFADHNKFPVYSWKTDNVDTDLAEESSNSTKSKLWLLLWRKQCDIKDIYQGCHSIELPPCDILNVLGHLIWSQENKYEGMVTGQMNF